MREGIFLERHEEKLKLWGYLRIEESWRRLLSLGSATSFDVYA